MDELLTKLNEARVRTMKTVAVIGASSDRSKYGNKAVRAFRDKGFQVFPVNPNESEVEGMPAFKSIGDLPVRPDWVTVYVRPSVLLELLPDVAAKGCDLLWLNPGTESSAIRTEVGRLGLTAVEGCSLIAIGAIP